MNTICVAPLTGSRMSPGSVVVLLSGVNVHPVV
jgi:hypothetical protein